MTKLEFAQEVKNSIGAYLPEEFRTAEICLEEVKKLNHSYTALIVRPQGCQVAPSIDLGQLYQMTEDGASFATVMRIAASLAMTKKPEVPDEKAVPGDLSLDYSKELEDG